MYKDPQNPPGKEEKHPPIDPQKPEKPGKPKLKANCEIHGVNKEVYCEDCDKFFCCRCMVDHLREKHDLKMFKCIDDLKGDLTKKLDEKIEVIENSQKEISTARNMLVKGAADFRDDKKLDALYKEIEANLKETINERKKEKNELYSRMNRLARELDTKECSHTTKLNSVQKDSKKISEGKAEAVIAWTEKLVSEGVFGKKARMQKGGEAKDVNKVIEDKKEAEVILEAEDKKETEVLKAQEADNNAELKKKVDEILDEAEKVKKEEMKSTLEQIEMKVIHRFYDSHFKDEIVKSTKQLDDYKRDIAKLNAEIEEKKEYAKKMEKHQASLQKQIKEVEKQIVDGRNYLMTIDVQYFKQESEKMKQKISERIRDSEAIKGDQEGIQAQLKPLLKDIEEGRKSLAQMKLEDFRAAAKAMTDGVASRAEEVKKIRQDQIEKTEQLNGLIKDIAEGKSALANLDVEGYKAEGNRLIARLNALKEEAMRVSNVQNDRTRELEAVSTDIKDGRTALKNMNVEDFKAKAHQMEEAVAVRRRTAEEIKAEQDLAIEDLRKVARETKAEIKTLMDDCKAKADALKNRTGGLEVASGEVEASQARTKKELEDIVKGVVKEGKKALEEIEARKGKAEELKAKIEAKARDAEALKVDHRAEIAKVTQIGEDVKGVFDAQKTDLKKCLQCGKAKCIACGLTCGCKNFYCKECLPGSIKYLFHSIDSIKCPNCKKSVCKTCIGCDFCKKSCKDCVQKCSLCDKKGCKEGECLSKCQLCEKKGCKDCFKACRKCNLITSPDHFQKCSACDKDTCTKCLEKCDVCVKGACKDCIIKCPCGKASGKNCLEPCKLCPNKTCKFCLKKCTKCGLDYGRECSKTCEDCKNSYCNKCIKKCETCQKENCGCCKGECNQVKCKKLLCKSSLVSCVQCGKLYCGNCAVDCEKCKKKVCVDCKINCEECKKPYDKACGNIEACAKCKKLKCKTCRDGCKFVGILIFNQ